MSTKTPERSSMPERFSMLRRLEKGWQGRGRGEPFGRAWLDRVEAFAVALVDEHGAPVPYIYGTPDHGVQLEWDTPRGSVDVLLVEADLTVSGIAVDVSQVETVGEVETTLGAEGACGRVAALVGEHTQQDDRGRG